MKTTISQNTSQTLTIPSEPGAFSYILEEEAELTLRYLPQGAGSQHITIELRGNLSSLKLLGFIDRSPDHDQSIEAHFDIIHTGKDTEAVAQIKGVTDSARDQLAITGTIRVEPGAIGTDTYYQADFLDLATGSVIKTQPNLEVLEADIIAAGHGSSCGHLAADQVQYLKSRGLSPDQAQDQLVEAFLVEMREKITDAQ